MPLNILTSDDACHVCVKSYAKKHDFKKGDKFDIQCRGISKQYVSDTATALLNSSISPEVVLDPIRWASEVLDWHCLDPDGDVWARKDPEEYVRHMAEYPGRKSKYHRPYQATMLRCLQGESQVFMGDGTVKSIQDISVGDKVITYNEGRKSIQNTYRILNKWQNGIKDIYRIELANGDVLKVTSNHPILSWSSEGKTNDFFNRKSFKRVYKSIDDGLQVGDKIYTLNAFKVFGDNANIQLAKILGYIVSDGYVSNSGLKGKKHILEFSNIRKQYVDEFAELLGEVFGIPSPGVKHYPAYIDKNGVNHQEHWRTSIYNRQNPVLIYLRSIGCMDKSNREISILHEAFRLSEEALGSFINRTWAGDGCVYNRTENHILHKRSTLSLSSGNIRFLELYRLLLKKISIYTSHIYIDAKKTSKTINLIINRIEDIENFFQSVGPIFGKEDQSLLAIEETVKRNHWNRTGSLKTTSRTEIKSITLLGQEIVWDIEVDTRHNFIADGLIVHNCTSKYKVFRIGRQSGKTETLVISILFSMFTNSNYKIVLITPFQSQIDLIFKRIEVLVQGNPTLANSIKRSVKAPQYTVTLHNGSEIIGFTAGTKSGNGAGSARGQHANMLVFDEGDYLDRSDLDAAMAIITNSPDATVWMSSTPTGRREKFYEICHDREWKEFHYPSHVNPNWTEQLDRLFKKNLTTIGYKHEILAEFGEQEEGVFQASYVDKAMAEYSYAACTPSSGWLYSIGVDWNSPKIGTTIYVTGFNPASNRFMLVEHMTIQREGWTQTVACEKIVELNRKWRPFAIYVDQGYGSVQIEILRKYGFDARIDPEKGPSHIDSRLPKVIKAFDFGSSIEIRDPFTKELRKKPAKGFLVENAVRRFEANDLMISKEDTQLKRELLGYIIKNITVTGQVVYTTLDDTIGDHNLDAVMLSLVAFTLEKSALGKPILNEKVQFTSLENRNSNQIIDKDLVPIKTQSDKEKQEQQKALRPSDRSELKGNVSNNKKVWDWPGFMRDEPRPINNGGYRGRSQSTTIFKRPHTGPSKRSSF